MAACSLVVDTSGLAGGEDASASSSSSSSGTSGMSGSALATATTGSPSAPRGWRTARELLLGASNWGNHVKGAIDDAKFYTGIVPDAEIAAEARK